MRSKPRRVVALAGVAATLMAVLAACGSNDNNSSAGSTSSAKPANTKVGVLLPDTASSPRWVSADPRQLSALYTRNVMSEYTIRPLGAKTWGAFVKLCESTTACGAAVGAHGSIRPVPPHVLLRGPEPPA